MSDDVVTASRGASLAKIVELMSRHRVKRIPIVEAGEVVGIVARSDLHRALPGAQPDVATAPVNDDQIRCNIVAELAARKWSGEDIINLTVGKGIARLSGAIFDEPERQAAIVAAENVDGVKALKDDLFCAEPLSVILVS